MKWYHGITELAWWYGYLGSAATTRVTTAPEPCSWLVNTWDGANAPCSHIDDMVYGYSYAFLRWLSDQFGPSYPGGEKALHRAIVAFEYSRAASEIVEHRERADRYAADAIRGSALR